MLMMMMTRLVLLVPAQVDPQFVRKWCEIGQDSVEESYWLIDVKQAGVIDAGGTTKTHTVMEDTGKKRGKKENKRACISNEP